VDDKTQAQILEQVMILTNSAKIHPNSTNPSERWLPKQCLQPNGL